MAHSVYRYFFPVAMPTRIIISAENPIQDALGQHACHNSQRRALAPYCVWHRHLCSVSRSLRKCTSPKTLTPVSWGCVTQPCPKSQPSQVPRSEFAYYHLNSHVYKIQSHIPHPKVLNCLENSIVFSLYCFNFHPRVCSRPLEDPREITLHQNVLTKLHCSYKIKIKDILD